MDQVVRGRVEAGCDEAGRGCLAGPVVAAAVVLTPDVARTLPLNDSKQLTTTQRDQLRQEVETRAVTWAVAFVTPEEIDKMNILQASFEAMRRAVRGLAGEPDHLLIDGNRFVTAPDMPEHSCFVKGDAKVASIAGQHLGEDPPRRIHAQGSQDLPRIWLGHQHGVPTVAHRQALTVHGPTPCTGARSSGPSGPDAVRPSD